MPLWKKDRIPLPEFKEDLDKLHAEIKDQFPQIQDSANTTLQLVQTYYYKVFPNFHPFQYHDKGISYKQRLHDTLSDHLAFTCAQQAGTFSSSQLSKLEDLRSNSENQYYDFVSHHFSTPGWNPQNFRSTLEAAKLWGSLLAIHGESGLDIEERKNVQFINLVTDLDFYFEQGKFGTVQTALGEKLGMHQLDWVRIRTSQQNQS